ncbi:MAG: pyruvate kinase [Candidatus Bipolaricaulota bacterium]|nr:pyruvate kinase [Candidatus Bipolaricaulota bacterium]MCS7274990.1 pyruvate kinase [Candidatus Bipolaricaulota bacterium]MDW8110545.1 pyruvate kinase [Candidatus Bipolaricaulota bacterium]MDW8329304.1 pyruvate kinase [Candidatus Bipolaricaulota bacterium]
MRNANKRTKIVCTVGPASLDLRLLQELIESGMNVARINMSHGTHAEHREMIARVRRAAAAVGTAVAVMVDTKGPAIRTGELKREKIALQAGQKLWLLEDPVLGDEQQISISYQGLWQHVRAGMKILLANGEIELRVLETHPGRILCEVLNSKELGERKRVSVPDVSLPGITTTDEDDIRFAQEVGVDYIAASFVQTGLDIDHIRHILGKTDIEIIAKIETREAARNIDDLIAASDGVMVARGDLGVELPPEEVPLLQKEIVRKCNRAGKPVIIATQMLKSMTENPTPTRAEVADVANAILDGTDAIMLSEETAIGKYPKEAVQMMTRIAQRIEQSSMIYYKYERRHLSIAEAIGESACQIAERIGAAAIIPSTTSGSTAKLVAKFRPRTPIIAVTYSERVCNKLALVWGVTPVRVEFCPETDTMLRRSIEAAAAVAGLKPGSPVVITAGVPFGVPGTTNLIKVERV